MKERLRCCYWLLVLLLLYTVPLQGQEPTLEWAKGVGGASDDAATHMVTDAAGNVYTTGYFSGTVDFDPGPLVTNLTSVGGFDVFVSKLDASGNFVWAVRMGGNSQDHGLGICLDINGNVHVTGYYVGIATFGAYTLTSTAVSDQDIFIVKLSNSGSVLWAKSMGGPASNEQGRSVTTDAAGNVYTTGIFMGAADMDPGATVVNLTSAGGSDVFLSKLDIAGNFVWVRQMGGIGLDASTSIKLDAFGAICLTGMFTGTADFAPASGSFNLLSKGNLDIFVAKFSNAGNLIWAKQMGGPGADEGMALEVDLSDNIYVTGDFAATADMDPGSATFNLVAKGMSDIFVASLNPSGDFRWANGIGGLDSDQGRGIAIDAQNNVYSTGYYKYTVDFNPGSSPFFQTALGNGIYVLKLDPTGGFTWVKSLIGNLNVSNAGTAIALDAFGNIYTAGLFAGTVDFDPGSCIRNLVSVGSMDIFVHKMSLKNTSTASHMYPVACDSFRFNGETYTSGGLYSDTFVNQARCDSVVFIHLTLHHRVESEVKVIACGTYTLNNILYTQSGIYTQAFTTGAGCDSIVRLGLTLNPIVYQTLYDTICGGTVYKVGSKIYTVSGTYIDTFISASTCDSIQTLHLFVLPLIGASIAEEVCYGATYTLGKQVLGTAGSYTEKFMAANGCDSTVRLQLKVRPEITATLAAVICFGENYTLGTQSFSVSGQYRDTFVAVNGCDSFVTLDLTVLPEVKNALAVDICYGASYTFGTQVLSTSGNFNEVFKAISGCDSLVTLQLSVLPEVADTITATICAGEQYVLDGHSFNSSGTYRSIFRSHTDCDSLVTLQLDVAPLPSLAFLLPDKVKFCMGDTIWIKADGALSYSWTNDVGSELGTGNEVPVFLPSSLNAVTITGTSSYGCKDTLSLAIPAVVCCRMDVPSAFSPNGDGLNDQFGAVPEGYLNAFRMQIFDRWGKMLFSASRPDEHWDGRVDGVPANVGIYYYLIRSQCGDSTSVTRKGDLTLIR